VGDSPLEEANHVCGELVRVVKEYVVAAVLELEELRAAGFEVLTVLDDLVSALRAEEVSVAENECDWEVEVWVHHPVFSRGEW